MDPTTLWLIDATSMALFWLSISAVVCLAIIASIWWMTRQHLEHLTHDNARFVLFVFLVVMLFSSTLKAAYYYMAADPFTAAISCALMYPAVRFAQRIFNKIGSKPNQYEGTRTGRADDDDSWNPNKSISQ